MKEKVEEEESNLLLVTVELIPRKHIYSIFEIHRFTILIEFI